MGRRNPFSIPRFPQRPMNYCKGCGYTWYPRGKDLSHRCPRCGSTSTGNYQFLSCLLLLAIIAATPFVLLFGLRNNRSSIDDGATSQPRIGTPLAVKPFERQSDAANKPSFDNERDSPTNSTPKSDQTGPKDSAPTGTAKELKKSADGAADTAGEAERAKKSDEAEEKVRKAKEQSHDKAGKARAEADREAERLRLQKQDAATLLQLAKSMVDTDKDRAIRSFQSLIKQFPKTKAAAEAKKLLANL